MKYKFISWNRKGVIDDLAVVHEVIASEISFIVIPLTHSEQNRVVFGCALYTNGLRGIFNRDNEAMQLLEACIRNVIFTKEWHLIRDI